VQTREILRIKGDALFTVAPSTTLEQALATMVELETGSLVVMDQGALAGLLTFREVLRALAQGGGAALARPVEQVMARDPQVVGPDVEMDELQRLMLETRARYVPVLEGRTLVGVLSFRDVARAVVEEQSFENQMLKGYIRNWPEE
jgi:CBS domain-containing protein